MANTFTYLNKEVKMICDSKSDTSATRQNCAATLRCLSIVKFIVGKVVVCLMILIDPNQNNHLP